MMDTGELHRRLPLFVKEELMNATILHESRGRIRLKMKQKRMTLPQADHYAACPQHPGAEPGI